MAEVNQEMGANQPDGKVIPEENPVNQPITPDGELDITMSEEDAQKLLEQAQQIAQGEQPAQQQQELLAGKFKNEEELQKGLINIIQKLTGTDDLVQVYKALESYLGQGGLEAAAQETEQQQQQEQVSADLDSLLDQFVDEYMQTGKVPEELLKQTEADPRLVEYALKAKAQEYQQYVQSVIEYAGGEQEYQKILNFVEKNLNPEERAAYAAAIQTMDPHLVTLVIDGVKARMQRAVPELIEGAEATVPTGGDVFNSVDEALAAITDPRYGVDPRYTQMVQAK